MINNIIDYSIGGVILHALIERGKTNYNNNKSNTVNNVVQINGFV